MTIKKTEANSSRLIILTVLLFLIVKIISTSVEEKITLANYKQVSYSDWYSAKSIKQMLKESEKEHISALLSVDIIANDKTKIQEKLKSINKDILKYEAEKTEILIGSQNIPKEYWAQDIDGEMGKIVGLREWTEISTKLSTSLSRTKIGLLFIQIAIIFSVMNMLIKEQLKLRKTFTTLTLVSGGIGIIISLYALSLAFI